MLLPAVDQAASLIADFGVCAAWQMASQQAIKAHLKRDNDGANYWHAVITIFAKMGARPGPSSDEVDRSARLLILLHGAYPAWEMLMQQASEAKLLSNEVGLLRTADAIQSMTGCGGKKEPGMQYV